MELQKFSAPQVENEQQRWIRFFKEGEQLNDETGLPEWMTTNEMRQAMNTLKQFSEKDRDYHAYQARQNYLREQLSRDYQYEEALKRERAALELVKEKDAELERLKELLAKSNLH